MNLLPVLKTSRDDEETLSLILEKIVTIRHLFFFYTEQKFIFMYKMYFKILRNDCNMNKEEEVSLDIF